MKKITATLLGLCLSTACLAEDATVTIFNTSTDHYTNTDHYMTVKYSICDVDSCSLPQTVNIFSSKVGEPERKNYVEVYAPINGKFNVVTVKILSAVEKKIVNGKPTQIVIAQTQSNGVCDIQVGETESHTALSDGVLELNDMNGSNLVVCKKGFV